MLEVINMLTFYDDMRLLMYYQFVSLLIWFMKNFPVYKYIAEGI